MSAASAHLDCICSTAPRASMKRASAWFVRSTTRKPMTNAYTWNGYGCPNASTIVRFHSPASCRAVVRPTLSATNGIVRGKGLPNHRNARGRPQYRFG